MTSKTTSERQNGVLKSSILGGRRQGAKPFRYIYIYIVVCCGMVWYGVVWCGLVGVVWGGLVGWFGVVWGGLVWFGRLVLCGFV